MGIADLLEGHLKMRFVAFVFALAFFIQLGATAAPTPPGQPSSGPGSAQYTHGSVESHVYGTGNLEYWLFEPKSPVPESAPVVIFSHGWGAMNPIVYRAWINHIVRRGNIVIYPRYQESLSTKLTKLSSNAVQAVHDAFERLAQEEGHVRPQLDKVAAVGHSAGGQISANITACAASSDLPPIKAVMCVEPGKSWGPPPLQIPLGDMATMPASTLLLTIAGDRDSVVRNVDARRIIKESVQVPPLNKDFVTLMSDNHGTPPLVANHRCPTAPEGNLDINSILKQKDNRQRTSAAGFLLRQKIEERLAQTINGQSKTGSPILSEHAIDALDYYGTWKLFDALIDAAFYNKNREYALGNTAQQRYMGLWSDGVPVKELVVQESSAPKSQR